MTRTRTNNSGFTLVDLVVTIVIAAILATVAIRGITELADTAKVEETKQELEQLEYAIVGNPLLYNDDTRSDFGYVGDVGAFPGNLDALYSNPGGYATWKGPYIKRRFEQDPTEYKKDAWGSNYTYTGGASITSTGSGSNIVREFGSGTGDFLLNGVDGVVLDVDGTPPGLTYKDSVRIRLTIPNGTGGYLTKSAIPDMGGFFSFDSIPIGNHDVEIIYTPDSDTLKRFVSVSPNSSLFGEYHLAADVWNGSSAGGGSSPEILRPMGVGSYTTNDDENCSNNWQCVDELTADEDGTFVKGEGGSWDTDTYATQNSSVSSGTIDSVIIYIRCKEFRARTAIWIDGNLHESNDINLTGSYTNYSETYTTNPETSSPWTWAEIDAIEIGVTLKEEAKCTQVWLEVYFTN